MTKEEYENKMEMVREFISSQMECVDLITNFTKPSEVTKEMNEMERNAYILCNEASKRFLQTITITPEQEKLLIELAVARQIRNRLSNIIYFWTHFRW